MEVLKRHAFVEKAINVRRLNVVRAKRAVITATEIIRKDHDDIRLRNFRRVDGSR